MSNQHIKKQTQPPTSKRFPIVGLGASAGGLDAFKNFFTHMPPDTDLAFVLVQHLDPTHESILVDLVQRYTRMPVQQVQEGMRVTPNNVYVIPPNYVMQLDNGVLHLTRPDKPRGQRAPIDTFLRSLAHDQQEYAIGIVLSGTGSEGALGLKAIKSAGGMAMVQDPETTHYDGMPYNAITTGLVDYILPPEKMPEQLINYVHYAFAGGETLSRAQLPDIEDALRQIFTLLRRQMGHDFSAYKPKTIQRRIERWMAVHQITQIEAYVQLLHSKPAEIRTLFRELLIGVTGFFRDPKVFEYIEKDIIPKLFKAHTEEPTLRIWVPGCATGEEVYSIAILIQESLDQNPQEVKVQIFATDIDAQALETARQCVYPETIAADVSPERLQHFFTKEDNVYRVKKHIRDMVIFAVQSLIKDPPFSNLDLISCRNVLIYLDTSLQKITIPLFHYALKPGGYLLLGTSETLGEFAEHFETVHRKWKVFRRPENSSPLRIVRDFTLTDVPGDTFPRTHLRQPPHTPSLRETMQRLLLKSYAPPSVIVNEQGEILHIHGRTGKYLEPAVGNPSTNILKMAREGLRTPLTTALHQAIDQDKALIQNDITVKTNGDWQSIKLTVKPLKYPEALQGLILVVFEDQPHPSPNVSDTQTPSITEQSGAREQRIAELEQELRANREYLQTTIEELETSNEELKSTNEELQSANEELQSTNEELETSKEELQSANEELLTVNNELQVKIDELTKANDDVSNLFNSVSVGIVFLDRRLQIQQFNPPAQAVINLIASDIGRPIQHLVVNLEYDDLVSDCEAVLATAQVKKMDVQSRSGRWYTLCIQPYLTLNNAIAGLVLTFADITDQKQMQVELEHHSEHLEQLVAERTKALQTSNQRLSQAQQMAHLGYWDWFMDTDEQHWSPETYHIFDQAPTTFTPTAKAFEALIHPDDLDRFLTERSHALETQGRLNIEHRIIRPDGTVRHVHETAEIQGHDDNTPSHIVGTIQDITDRKHIEEQLKVALAEKETLLRELYHRTKNNMQVICAMLDLQSDNFADERLVNTFKEMQNRIRAMALVHRKLYESQNLSRVELDDYIIDLIGLLQKSYQLHPDQVTFAFDLEPVSMLIDTAIPCGMLINELVSNALKHAFPDKRPGEIHIQLSQTEAGEISLGVADNGVGVPDEFDFRECKSTGLRTIFALGEHQLHGTVTFEKQDGITCRVHFQNDLYTARV